MTEPVVLTGPQRIIRRVVAERRAGAPDEMIAKYAITEALHLLTGHDGPAADCTRCHQAAARAVNDVRSVADMTGASIVVPDPLNPPAYAWGESVTWNQGRVLVPLNRDDQTVADLRLTEAQAGELVDHLLDLIEPEPELGYDYGRAVNAPLSQPTIDALNKQLASGNFPSRRVKAEYRLDLQPMPCHQPQRTWASNHGCDPCATCGRCRICDAVARGPAEQTPHSEESTHADQ